jgi:CMP-N-acetylneuraminic acid synthetase
MKRLALIPAKGKSTRLPRKNVIDFCGKPMLAWSIEAALQSRLFEDVVVSTEDQEIANVSLAWGASVPFIRAGALARDPAGVEAVALDALERLAVLGREYDTLAILLPTCPLRTVDDVVAAMALFDRRQGKSLMSVTPFEYPPQRAYRDAPDDLLEPLFPGKERLKVQELEPTYRCNGALHILDVPFFRAGRSYTCAPLIKYVMPRERSVDIDTLDDLRFAEFIRRQTTD